MKENNANKGSALSAEVCIVMWDTLDECANRNPEPFCETTNTAKRKPPNTVTTQKAKTTRSILKIHLVVQSK
jgi:hypothetical protein